MDERQYFRVLKSLYGIIPQDFHRYGFETENDFLAVIGKAHRAWAGFSGECMEERPCMRRLRFRNKYGGYDDAWFYDFMLEHVPSPETPERDYAAERMEEQLNQIFGFDP